jgi:hypothetical protein
LHCEETGVIRVAAYVVGVAFAGTAWAVDVPPSGIDATLYETIYEPQGVTAATAKIMRLRYLAPEITDRVVFGFDAIEADFAWFCARDGLQNARDAAPMVEQIIVSVASEIVGFGETAPNVVQYFDAFRVQDATCIWEGL